MRTVAELGRFALVPSGTWEIDAARSTVAFEVRHLGLTQVQGRFDVIAGTISCNGAGVASIDGAVGVASVDTGDARRDALLRASDFFDIERHPTICFSGVAAPAGTGAGLVVRGTMTMRGVSRPLELRAEPSRAAAGGNHGDLRIRAQGIVSRRDFELDWDPAFAFGGLVIGDRVRLRFDVAVVRRAAASRAAEPMSPACRSKGRR